jgi:hypothetical protein
MWLLCISFILAGCPSLMTEQSQQVAKNWFSVVRGTQVFPVNPLRADLTPGDIYIVNQTIEEQSNADEDKNYLPLDHKLATLKIEQSPESAAAMPTFSFTVDQSAGFQLNVPVEGIPVGLGLLNSKKVVVSLSIDKVTVRDVGTIALYEALEKWAAQGNIQRYLMLQAQVSKHPLMLRTISTVYYTGGVTASFKGLDSKGLNVVGGTAPDEKSSQEIATLLPEAVKSDQESNRLIELAKELNKINPLNAVGGNAKFVKSSDNTVSMNNTFDPPLAIGYVGIDVIFNKSGRLGPPMIFFTSTKDLYAQPVQSKQMADYNAFVGLCQTLDAARQGAIAVVMADFIDAGNLAWKNSPRQFWSDLNAYMAGGIDVTRYNAIVEKLRSTYIQEVENEHN